MKWNSWRRIEALMALSSMGSDFADSTTSKKGHKLMITYLLPPWPAPNWTLTSASGPYTWRYPIRPPITPPISRSQPMGARLSQSLPRTFPQAPAGALLAVCTYIRLSGHQHILKSTSKHDTKSDWVSESSTERALSQGIHHEGEEEEEEDVKLKKDQT